MVMEHIARLFEIVLLLPYQLAYR